ncbi:molybdopterin-dependent oxidoreductase [Aminithiophilus ramosus]|uniref:Molybdopterin-dependent oxidoreductase n=1 Tax=Aminithiophilus ramosus TaxID=3029084 RepID=A0A9Q7AE61_9BACT|nr:molybdopterin-dependent aldehyde oxidoreductase [Aminithiophilus ramosus]QTX32684.1 molybdopterin-dependent oxidoreductase [Aminithiophilus ramosus]
MKQYFRKSIMVNGCPHSVVADPETTLADVIRRQLGLTGTKVGCGVGQCGVCNVLMDGKLVQSCIVKWSKVSDGASILTIEGMGAPGRLHALQWAFIKCGGFQCGFCTPGFIVSAKGLLDENHNPTREDVRDWFQKHRNACRCTGYVQIVDAVMLAAKVLRGEEEMTDFSEMLGKDGAVWGTYYPRPSAVYKVTGTWDFGDDVALKLPEGTLFAACVCPETHHARVKKIDFSEAEKMPGVVKIVTAADIFANKGTNRIRGQVGSGTATTDGWERRILVPEGDKIRQWGESVAIVCADTETLAREAAKAVKVELEELTPLLYVKDAMAPGAIKVYDEIADIDGIPNAFNKRPIIKGDDPKAALDRAPFVVDEEFYSSRQPHLTMETDCGFGYYDEEGRLTLQTKSICVYRHQLMIARGLGVAPSKIRVIQNNMGASFGYKVAPTNEPLLGACVIATGRPVYMRLDMKEHIVRTPKRSPFLMKVRVGADEKGKIVGLENHWYVDHGPYSESSQDLTNKGGQFMLAPYHVDDIRGCGYTLFTNHRWSAAFRAYGAPQTYHAGEIAVDMLAEKAGIDPLEFRERNLLRVGDTLPSGQKAEVYPLQAMVNRMRPYYEEAKAKAEALSTDTVKRGVGISIGIYNSNDDGADDANSHIELTRDGVTLYNTWEDHGQGADMGCVGTAHEALRPLGLKPEQIKLVLSDTAKAPNSGAAAASRCQVMVGMAIVDSCQKLLNAMRRPDGTYRTYDEMIAENIPVYHEGYYKATLRNVDGEIQTCTGMDDATGQGYPFANHMFGIFLAEVAVELATGKTTVERFTLVSDVGKINNFAVVEGQQYGGIAQGIGLALSEDFVDMRKHNNLIGCGLPFIKDVPDAIRLIHLESPREFGPFGASGTGEMPLSAPHPAILNAINNACGVRLTTIPATPERVLEGLKAKKA